MYLLCVVQESEHFHHEGFCFLMKGKNKGRNIHVLQIKNLALSWGKGFARSVGNIGEEEIKIFRHCRKQ